MTDVATAARFWAKVDRRGPDECWLWLGYRDPRGYGHFKMDGRAQPAHRVAVQIDGREVLAGMEPDHLCRNPPCVNPAHLEVVTHRENGLRGVSPAAENARKRLCPRGHELTGENLVRYELDRGIRRCRTCRNDRARLRRRATRASA